MSAMPDLPADRDALLAQWVDLVQTQEPTGTCPTINCDGHLRALPAEAVGTVLFLEAECDHCGRVVASPNGRKTTPVTARPALASFTVHRVQLAAVGADAARVPDWRERAVGTDW